MFIISFIITIIFFISIFLNVAFLCKEDDTKDSIKIKVYQKILHSILFKSKK